MSRDPFNNLSHLMQERLDKWKKNPPSVKNHVPRKEKSPGNYVARRRDYGDDMKEFERK